MKLKTIALALLVTLVYLPLVLLSGCTNVPVITSSPPNALQAVAAPGSQIAVGLQDAAYNFDSAVAIGALSPNDPAPACIHNALQQAGLELSPGQTAVAGGSFTPRVSDAISAGSVAYILAAQLRAAGPLLTVDVSCKALIGGIVIDALSAAGKVGGSFIPGGSLIRGLTGK